MSLPALAALCGGLGLFWATLFSWRAPGGTLRAAARAVLGGALAAFLALGSYGLLERAGWAPSWDAVVAGGWTALATALLVGALEETAKLLACVAAGADPPRRDIWEGLRVVGGVSAVFAVIEVAVALRGAPAGVAAFRAVFAPLAHGLLAAPFAPFLASLPGARHPRWPRRGVLVGLAAAVLAHGLSDFFLGRPGWGPWAYAATLLVPTLWLFVYTRRLIGWPMPWERRRPPDAPAT
jgi:RsiW-degrading membrane proteinase PrsW (M82 family)